MMMCATSTYDFFYICFWTTQQWILLLCEECYRIPCNQFICKSHFWNIENEFVMLVLVCGNCSAYLRGGVHSIIVHYTAQNSQFYFSVKNTLKEKHHSNGRTGR